MNILVIGNGFDLAHELPTKYTDFLEFCKRVFPIYDAENRRIDLYPFYQQKFLFDWNFNKEIKEALKNAFKSRQGITVERNQSQIQTDYPRLEEMYLFIKDNIWIEYFFQCNMYQKENWIDFESEISDVIQSLDDDMKLYGLDSNIQCISNKFLNEKYYDLRAELTYKMLRNTLLNDLNRLIRALEIYLCEYVEKIDTKVISPDIKDIAIQINPNTHAALPAKVISFNYTNTFERLYDKGKNIEYDFIHGKADINNTIESNNMVLGIDEYLGKKRRNKAVEFIAFKKFYQRIHKQTGCRYKEWIDKIKREYEDFLRIKEAREKRNVMTECQQHNLYIFGHSLDVTDKDILRDLILNDNVHTTIFYHNKDAMGQQIANLVKVIGQKELIKRTGGSTKTIEFVPQKPMKPIND